MQNLPYSLLILFYMTFCVSTYGQNSHSGNILIQFPSGQTPTDFAERFSRQTRIPLVVDEKVSDMLRVWSFSTPDSLAATCLEYLQKEASIGAVQYNFAIQMRDGVLPNDPLFWSQWQLSNSLNPAADMDAPDAWNFSTGGLTPAGDSVVIAVFDGGIDAQHVDLQQNMWRNYHEIPDDNIDNDNNGYVDDFAGWNVWTENDAIAGSLMTHGTAVSGIAGARGNNGIGITGVNWNTQIMFVAGTANVTNALKGYDYIWKARKQYNESNGEKGAFVVAVNCSWGVNFGQPSEAPLWCAALDSLGAVGVLTVAATANLPINVDEAGDLPTTCPSDYLIAVTNLNKNNELDASAAWGEENIDLGAYGTAVMTTTPGNNYELLGGTSFAAPQVTGALGLLYSSACPELIALTKTHPAQAALLARSLLLENTIETAALHEITQSGGRLNLHEILSAYEEECADCSAPFALAVNESAPNLAHLAWSTALNTQKVHLRWRQVGAGDWNYQYNIQSPFTLGDLENCTSYEYALRAFCTNGEESDWSEPVQFSTAGCCTPPGNILITFLPNQGIKVTWTGAGPGTMYKVLIFKDGVGLVATFETSNNFIITDILEPCTNYTLKISTLCINGQIPLQVSEKFSTPGCNICSSTTYCSINGGSAADEWIQSITIGDWWNESGPAGNGYQDYTGQFEILPYFELANQTPISITPGYSGSAINEYFRVFLDFNHDGDFNDAGELAFDPGFAQSGPVNGFINVPAQALEGVTRMRVMMKYKSAFGTPPVPCESFQFGQVEDYCVLLGSEASAVDNFENNLKINISPQPALSNVQIDWSAAITGISAGAVLDVFNTNGQVIYSSKTTQANQITLDVSDWPAGCYVVRLCLNEQVLSGKIIKT